MHSEDVLSRAREMREAGVGIHQIARELGVSAGWASANLRGIVVSADARSEMLQACDEEMLIDRERFAARRRKSLASVKGPQVERRWDHLKEMVDATDSMRWRPKKGSREYKALDNLQGLFANDPGSWVFHLVGEREPRLLSHLVKWQESKRKIKGGNTRAAFLPIVAAIVEFLRTYKRAPSSAATDERERQMAHFISRWKSAAVGSPWKKANSRKAAAMVPLCKLVDELRSPYPDDQRMAEMKLRDDEHLPDILDEIELAVGTDDDDDEDAGSL